MTRLELVDADGVLKCEHGGIVQHGRRQPLVHVAGARVLVHGDPEQKPIVGCPIAAPAKLCTITLQVQAGYSELLFIDGRPVCLRPLTGVTDGVVPGTMTYRVAGPGHHFVAEVR